MISRDWFVSARLVCLAGALLQAGIAAAPGGAFARDLVPIGEAEQVVREVRGIFGEITRELVLQDEVYSEEVVETGAEAATRIVFRDGTELTMGPHSRVILDSYVYDPQTGAGELVASFVSGVFELASGLIPNTGYDLRTPFANLAIRGTRVLVLLGPLGEYMQIAVPEGAVTVLYFPTGEVTISDGSLCLIWTEIGPPTQVSIESCAELNERYVETALLLLQDVEPGAPPQGGFGGPGLSTLVPPGLTPISPEAGAAITNRVLCELAAAGLPVPCPSPN